MNLNNQTLIGSAKCLPSVASEAIVNAANEVNSLSLKMVKYARLISAGNDSPVSTSDSQNISNDLVSAVMGLRIFSLGVQKERVHQRLLALMYSNRLFSIFSEEKQYHFRSLF